MDMLGSIGSMEKKKKFTERPQVRLVMVYQLRVSARLGFKFCREI